MLLCRMAQAEVYISKEEALKNIFSSFDKDTIETMVFNGQPIEVSTVTKEGKVIGWAVALDEMGKIKPVTFWLV